MKPAQTETDMPGEIEESFRPVAAGGGPDDDDRDDERADENEIPVRETDEQTEAPEEFQLDDEDDLGHPEDDDADDELADDEDGEDEGGEAGR